MNRMDFKSIYLLNEFRLSLLSPAKANNVSRFPIRPPIPTVSIPTPENKKKLNLNIITILRTGIGRT